MRILIYGLAKSGTTVLHLQVKEGMERHFNEKVSEVFEAVRRDGDTLYKRDGSSYELSKYSVVKSLLPPEENMGVLPDTMLNEFDDFDKKIFIVRDPRDRWVSDFFYRWFHLHNPRKDEFERAHRLTRYKEEHPKDLPFYTLFTTNPKRNESWKGRQVKLYSGLQYFLDKARQKDWYVMKYEDLMDGQYSDLEKYLGFKLGAGDPVDKRFAHVARSKNHGNWRRWFTVEDIEFYKPLYYDYLKECGYDPEDWELTPVDSLPSSEGSEYMYRLYSGGETKRKIKSLVKKLLRR